MAKADAWVIIPKLDKDKTGCVLDMRPLVLCKDCKNYDRDENMKLGTCLENGVCSTPDWFCADGERRS
jgi:hypothetical protein